MGLGFLRRNSGKALFSDEEVKQLRKLAPVKEPVDQSDAEKERERRKALYLFGGDTGFKECLHEFGYLADILASKKPIPDECFGCSKLVECTRTPYTG